MKKNNKKGFTLAELLVVVAIIAVLVAIAIPVFSAATEKAQKAVYQANARATLAQATVDYLEDDKLDTTSYNYGEKGGSFTASYDSTNKIISVSGEGLTCDSNNPEPSEGGSTNTETETENENA